MHAVAHTSQSHRAQPSDRAGGPRPAARRRHLRGVSGYEAQRRALSPRSLGDRRSAGSSGAHQAGTRAIEHVRDAEFQRQYGAALQVHGENQADERAHDRMAEHTERQALEREARAEHYARQVTVGDGLARMLVRYGHTIETTTVEGRRVYRVWRGQWVDYSLDAWLPAARGMVSHGVNLTPPDIARLASMYVQHIRMNYVIPTEADLQGDRIAPVATRKGQASTGVMGAVERNVKGVIGGLESMNSMAGNLVGGLSTGAGCLAGGPLGCVVEGLVAFGPSWLADQKVLTVSWAAPLGAQQQAYVRDVLIADRTIASQYFDSTGEHVPYVVREAIIETLCRSL